MSEDNVKKGFGKYVWIIGVVALFGTGGLFAYLESLGLQITCEDRVCDVNNICEVYCNVKNPTSQSVYLFNHDDWKITFSPEINEFDLYAKYYGKWRYTNFTKATRFPNIPDDKLYVFVFPRYSTKEFKLEVKLIDTARIKWNFGELDPIIQPYEYIYKNLSKQVPVYTKVCTPTIDAKNVSHIEDCISKVSYKTEYYKGDKTGVMIDKKETKNPYVYVNEKKGTLSESLVPWGNRNFNDPLLGQGCRDYEIEKGVCIESAI